MTFSDEFSPLTPINFFQISADCLHIPKIEFPYFNKQNYRKHLLPDMAALCSEDSFAEVAIGWHADGLEIYARMDYPLKQVYYPQVDRGDSVEIFIDTRDVKTGGFNTKFCHHFFFLAEGVEDHFAGEITRFRTEDMHPLCDEKELKVKSSCQSTLHTMNISIPGHCLYGYDPEQFKRIGFSYRINRAHGFPQHFSVASDDYQIDQQPSLWASLQLV